MMPSARATICRVLAQAWRSRLARPGASRSSRPPHGAEQANGQPGQEGEGQKRPGEAAGGDGAEADSPPPRP